MQTFMWICQLLERIYGYLVSGLIGFVKIFRLSCEFTNFYWAQTGLIICGLLVNGLKHLREGTKVLLIVTNNCGSSFKSKLFNKCTKYWSVLRSFRLFLQILSATVHPVLSWNCSISLRNLGKTLRPQCKIHTFPLRSW